MGRIQQIQSYCRQNTEPKKQSQTNFAYRQSFSSAVPKDVDKFNEKIAKGVAEEVSKNLGPVKKVIHNISMKLDETSGEVQTQVVNAIFTTTLAPLMIAYNPFSKGDEDTKKYSAMRQPISAGIAITAGFGMTAAINKFMSTLGSEGHLPYIDGRIVPDKTYLKPGFKKEHNIKGLFFTKDQKANFEKHVEDIQEKRKNLFASLLYENPKKIKVKDAKGIFAKGKFIGENIPGFETQEKLDKYLKEHSFHNRTLGDFMREHYKFEFYDDKTIKPSTVENKLKEIKALDFLKKIGIIGEETEAKGMRDFDGKELAKVLNLKGDASKMTLEELFEHLKVMDKVDSSKPVQATDLKRQSQVQEFMNKNLVKALEDFAKPFQSGASKCFNSNAGIKEIVTNIMSNKISIVGKNFKNFKSFAGIFFNLFTTMISCTALNWSYPRIMEKCFPELCGDNHHKKHLLPQEGGDD